MRKAFSGIEVVVGILIAILIITLALSFKIAVSDRVINFTENSDRYSVNILDAEQNIKPVGNFAAFMIVGDVYYFYNLSDQVKERPSLVISTRNVIVMDMDHMRKKFNLDKSAEFPNSKEFSGEIY